MRDPADITREEHEHWEGLVEKKDALAEFRRAALHLAEGLIEFHSTVNFPLDCNCWTCDNARRVLELEKML